MKRIFPIFLITLFLFYFSSCEKDDICVEGDTPLLVIGFYDADDTTEFKTVTDLRIRSLDNDSILNNSTDFGFSDRGNVRDSITIPLRIAASESGFEFISRSAEDDEGNETGTIDTLTFNYVVNQEFISRACGFIANFNELDTTRNVFSSDWIRRITLLETDVERSNTIHVKVFH